MYNIVFDEENRMMKGRNESLYFCDMGNICNGNILSISNVFLCWRFIWVIVFLV